jgi:hypothetical protein
MAEDVDDVAQEFANEIAPASRPRDQAGKFIRESRAPEPMFGERPIEGDPLTGDTRDGGDDQGLRAREREIADGREQGRTAQNAQNLRRAADDEGDDLVDEGEPENLGAVESDDVPAVEDGGQKYEVIVDGQRHEVSLNEALRGYVRQATFHQRMEQVNNANREVENEFARLQQGWAMWNKARADYEEDLANLIPQEPNWDQEFARDPQNAHATQKIYQGLYAKLAYSRQMRAQREQAEAAEADRRVQKYAVEGFTKFVMDHNKLLPDEPTLNKNIQSMRRTAKAAGFNDYEIATVYDPRMLTVLLKASRFDRMTANKPQAVIADRGKTLTPGAATPLGNARRTGLDDAQRQLARSGKMQDAVEVFRRLF